MHFAYVSDISSIHALKKKLYITFHFIVYAAGHSTAIAVITLSQFFYISSFQHILQYPFLELCMATASKILSILPFGENWILILLSLAAFKAHT